eukprot:464066-Pleurochrysis_carterae.AAC.1
MATRPEGQSMLIRTNKSWITENSARRSLESTAWLLISPRAPGGCVRTSMGASACVSLYEGAGGEKQTQFNAPQPARNSIRKKANVEGGLREEQGWGDK